MKDPLETEYMSWGDICEYVEQEIENENPEFYKKRNENLKKITEYYSRLLPEDREKFLKRLKITNYLEIIEGNLFS